MFIDLNLEWGQSLPLERAPDSLYAVDLDAIPDTPGVYVFFRAFGKSATALYVGKAGKLRSRIKQQLNALKLMKGIENAAIGRRFIAFGELRRRPGQQISPCLALIEHALIRYYLANKHELLNIHGNRIRKHSLASERHGPVLHHLIPKSIDFE